ncbi:MAG: prepilin-type N-terminal cleavage/methylation domain-containing protein [Endomicrobia bacterium]|nr:prepilin-type N-terminal cleavage/methylation domain-containing protein [Endomicrobiia bacterium]MCL2799571.1 prepilin-type N-terminal cleavage/methylation domain-containing protein [Endomicrobiia bacterium]
MKIKGFTLIEVLVAIVLSAMLITVMAGMMLYGQKTFEEMYSDRSRMQDYLFFKKRLDSHLRRMVSPGFELTGGPAADVGFDKWSGAGGSSNWSDRVQNGVTFFSVNPENPGEIIKGQYVFDGKNIVYSEWSIRQDVERSFSMSATSRIDKEIILRDVKRFQATNMFNGIANWEFNNIDGQPVNNYLRIFLELNTKTTYKNVSYSFTEDYINNSVSRTLIWKGNPSGGVTGPGDSDVITKL